MCCASRLFLLTVSHAWQTLYLCTGIVWFVYTVLVYCIVIPTLTSCIIYCTCIWMWRLCNKQYSNILYNDYSHNIIDNHVPLASLALHMHMDDDSCMVWVFTWEHPCHPQSQWSKSRDLGKSWLTLSKEPKMPTLYRAITTSSKSFVCIIIAVYPHWIVQYVHVHLTYATDRKVTTSATCR